MSLNKRISEIEISLTPKDAAIGWLKDMVEMGDEAYTQKMLADPRNPRVLVTRMVADAVRQNHSLLATTGMMETAVREARKQTDLLMLLVLDLHKRVRSKCEINHPYTELLRERFHRLLLESEFRNKCVPEEWDLWRALLEGKLFGMRVLKEIVLYVSNKYYDGQPLLFATDQDCLNSQIVSLEELTSIYNHNEKLPRWKELNIDDSLPLIRKHAENMAEVYFNLAKINTLKDFGEEGMATELLEVQTDHVFRKIKQARSSSSQQDTFTS